MATKKGGSKKTARIQVVLQCTVTGRVGYTTTYNKKNTDKIQLMKYNPVLRKHTLHKVREKMK